MPDCSLYLKIFLSSEWCEQEENARKQQRKLTYRTVFLLAFNICFFNFIFVYKKINLINEKDNRCFKCNASRLSCDSGTGVYARTYFERKQRSRKKLVERY